MSNTSTVKRQELLNCFDWSQTPDADSDFWHSFWDWPTSNLCPFVGFMKKTNDI